MIKKKSVDSQYREYCIFCKGGDLSDQHVWPAWLMSVLPKGGGMVQARSTILPLNSNSVLVKPNIKLKQGCLLSTRFKKVCRSCNSGWISRLEQRLIPQVTKLIRGELTEIDCSEMGDFATWVAIVTIMAEYSDIPLQAIPLQAIPKEDVEYIFQTSRPPSHWRIMVGRYVGEDQAPYGYSHTGSLCVARKQKEISKGMKPNIQTTVFVLGELIVFCASSTSPVFHAAEIAVKETMRLALIWPPTLDTQTHLRLSSVGDPHFDDIRYALLHMM